jgi:hypothetical protein
MYAKKDLVQGLRDVAEESKRVSALLNEQGDWEVKRPAGWTPKEMYCHVAAVANQLATTGSTLLTMPEDFDFTSSTNITEMNAKTVASMSGMSPAELSEAVVVNYGKMVDWVNGMTDEQLAAQRTFAQMKMPMSDLIANLAVLHGHHHLFEAALRTAF